MLTVHQPPAPTNNVATCWLRVTTHKASGLDPGCWTKLSDLQHSILALTGLDEWSQKSNSIHQRIILSPSTYMIILTVFFNVLSWQTSTQPYFILKVLKGSDWGSIMLRSSSSSCHAACTDILTLSRHFSLLFITSGRSSRLHPVSSRSCCMYVQVGRPAFPQPYARVHWSTSLMSSSLLLQQCLACLVRLTRIVFMMGGRWPYMLR